MVGPGDRLRRFSLFLFIYTSTTPVMDAILLLSYSLSITYTSDAKLEMDRLGPFSSALPFPPFPLCLSVPAFGPGIAALDDGVPVYRYHSIPLSFCLCLSVF